MKVQTSNCYCCCDKYRLLQNLAKSASLLLPTALLFGELPCILSKSSVFEGKDGSTGSYSGIFCLLTGVLRCENLPLLLSTSSVLDGSDGTGDSAMLGDEDLRVAPSRLTLRRNGESLCLEVLGLASDCSI